MSAMKALLVLLLLVAVPAMGAETDANGLAAAMRQARLSDGFEARMSVLVTKADGRHNLPIKIAVIGQFSSDRQRLVIRGISPEQVRGRFIAAERTADGRIRAISYGAQTPVVEADPFARLFDSGMTIWDMFGAWWSWPDQSLDGDAQAAGRACTFVRSRNAVPGPVQEVASCIDRGARLSLKTQLFNRQQAAIRTISVEQTMRKESGLLAAKKLLVTESSGTLTAIEIYGGDEQYVVTPDTFAALDARLTSNK